MTDPAIVAIVFNEGVMQTSLLTVGLHPCHCPRSAIRYFAAHMR